ncbi:MAG: efflux RND transporter periplasmic adaptor subunit [Geothrix sp.]|nr:efflux RND transporter periplasmic adaptor subunit [Geothrix sp.]
MKRNTWIGLGIGVVVVAGGAWWALRKPAETIKWRSAKVERGNVAQRISATGTLNALVQVPVGTQVSGTIAALYADYNSLVKKGQVIAQIDSTIWEAQLKDAEASVQRAQATYDNARAEFERTRRLAAEKLVADQDLDTKSTAMKTAMGNLESAKASLVRARVNLSYCTISAPVEGVVVARAVDVGQTVAASFNTPNLFTIARDLARMKVEASIDEADIGQVKVGQRAFFTVDSFPDKQFTGSVSEVRLEPIVSQNVVTYKVVMEVTNEPRETGALAEALKEGEGRPGRAKGAGPDLDAAWERAKAQLPPGATKEAFVRRAKERMSQQPVESASGGTARYIPAGSPVYRGTFALLPGMTANVTIFTQSRQDVLRVPNAALRFNPSAFVKEDAAKQAAPQAGQPGPAQQGGQRGGGPLARGMVSRREDRIWTLENGKPKSLTVKAGISDGQFTAVSGEGLSEGQVILVGVEDSKKAQTQSASPLGGAGGLPRR